MILQPNRIVDQPALDALDAYLRRNNYSQHARESIVRHAAAEGTPTGSPYLESEDEAGATGAFTRAMDAVPYDSPAWDDPSVWLDVDSIMDAAAAAAVEPPDDWKGSAAAGWALIPPELEDMELPPVCGGGPEDEPFNPTPEDERAYLLWLRESDGSIEPSRPDRHSAGSLEAVSRALYGRDPYA
jgi:hypothetical protein